MCYRGTIRQSEELSSVTDIHSDIYDDIKPIAFYLPQFHTIPENDEWWGKGFTEWTNVKKAKPLFDGHDQPKIPFGSEYYDLSDPDVMNKQAQLAKEHGIYGFCFYHYWFKGKRLLEKPVDDLLVSGKPDFPFCLCWANETWSKRWLGEEKDILQKQEYSDEDDVDHVRWLVEVFTDERYIKINERPLFLIYKPKDLPSPEKIISIFKDRCNRSGLNAPYLIGVNSHC